MSLEELRETEVQLAEIEKEIETNEIKLEGMRKERREFEKEIEIVKERLRCN